MKDGENPPCQTFNYVVSLSLIILTIVANGYIFFVNILVKEKRTAFGLLLLLYSGSIIFILPVNAFGGVLLQSAVPLNSQLVCYIHVFFFMQGIMVHEAFAVCILAHIAFIMYYSNKLRADMPNTKLFKRYTAFVGGMQILFSIFIILYDVATGNYSCVLVSNGYCTSLLDPDQYDTLTIVWANTNINKVLQIIIFGILLAYYYKYKSNITEVHAANKIQTSTFSGLE